MKKVAVLQSNYIPWKGYFDLIAHVDEFIIYDEVQYTKNDWRNRNRIKTPNGVQWMSIPVSQGLDQRIMDVVVKDKRWPTKHWKTLEANYRKSPHFTFVSDSISEIYLEDTSENLSEINTALIRKICSTLEIETKISTSTDYVLEGDRNDRLISLCRQANATSYVSGPAAKSYLDENSFSDSKVEVEWFDYSGYPEYPQLWGEFAHDVSVLDLMFNCGLESRKFMKHLSKD